MRTVAVVTLLLGCAGIAALATAGAIAPERLDRVLGEESPAASRTQSALAILLFLPGFLFLFAAAFSERIGRSIVTRETRSFLVRVSPLVVLVVVVALQFVPERLAATASGGILIQFAAGRAGLLAAVVVLSSMTSLAGAPVSHAMGLRSPGSVREGLSAGLVAWLTAKPLMFVGLSVIAVVSFAADRTIAPQDAVRQLVSCSAPSFAVIAAGVVLVVPVLEEIAFRVFFYGSLRRYLGVFGAALASGGVFAFLHASPDQILQLFVLGVVLALVYEKTQTIVAPVFLHMLINAEGVLQIALLRAG